MPGERKTDHWPFGPTGRIPKPPEGFSWTYVANYHRQLWNVLKHRPVDTTLKAICRPCGREGVLGRDVMHIGPIRKTNLVCNDCYVAKRGRWEPNAYLETRKADAGVATTG